MKSVWMFVLGAVLASGIVYYSVRPDERGTETPVETAVNSEFGQKPPAAAPMNEPTPAATPGAATPAASPSATTPEVETARPAPKPKAAARPSKAEVKHKPVKDEPARETEAAAKPKPSPTEPEVAQAEPASPAPDPVASLPLPTPPAPIAAAKVEPPKPREPQTVTLPAGTLITVRVDEMLSTAYNVAGDSFRATLDQPIVVDGLVIAEKGSRLEGRVVEADRSGRVKGRAHLAIELVRMNTTDGQRIRLQTATFEKEARASKRSDAAKIGAAAGIGAAIGAIAGGGKGAAIGAAAGGAAGTGGVMATRGRPAEIPSETKLSFRLSEPITITEKIP
ncbi:MAG: hypothetical protein ACRD7E_23120 [Bryobacteraceae bacterium]